MAKLMRTLSALVALSVVLASTGMIAYAVDRDDNPPGLRGGPGTNWENPRGPRGGLGASPDKRFDDDDNPPGLRGGPGTDWENPPGPKGGPGASRNQRRWRWWGR